MMGAIPDQLEDGTTSFYSHRQPAWFRLGNIVPDGLAPLDALQAVRLAGWNMRKEQVGVLDVDRLRFAVGALGADMDIDTQVGLLSEAFLPIIGKHGVVRDHPLTGAAQTIPGAVVGDGYEIAQNEDSAEWLDAFLGESHGVMETCGSMYGGREVFMSIALPTHITIKGITKVNRKAVDDQIDLYVLVVNRNDGTGSWQAYLTSIRAVCQNTIALAKQMSLLRVKIPHRANAADRRAAALETFGVVKQRVSAVDAEIKRLAGIAVGAEGVDKFLESLFPVHEKMTDRSKNMTVDRRSTVRQLYFSSPTNANIVGSGWGLYNAVAEYADWMLPVKGGDDERAARILSSMTDSNPVSDLKARAYNLLAG